MTRLRWLLVLGAVVVVGAAVAAGVIASSSAARPSGPPRVRAQQLAPRGDGGLLRRPQSTPGAHLLIDLHRIRRVHRSYFDVPFFVANHLPGTAQRETTSGIGGRGIPYDNEEDTYVLPTSGNIADFWLDLTFVRLPHDWTGIRADALVASCPCVYH